MECVPVAILSDATTHLIGRSRKGFHHIITMTTRSDAAATTTEIMLFCCLSKIWEVLAKLSHSQKNYS
jgi:hypothetical protein